MKRYEITTAKGSMESNDLRAISIWQREHQGALASIEDRQRDVTVCVDDIAFDDDAAVASIEALLATAD